MRKRAVRPRRGGGHGAPHVGVRGAGHVLAAGFKYFLEGSGIEELLQEIEPKAASREAKAEFVIYHATFDAYPAWLQDLPNK